MVVRPRDAVNRGASGRRPAAIPATPRADAEDAAADPAAAALANLGA